MYHDKIYIIMLERCNRDEERRRKKKRAENRKIDKITEKVIIFQFI